MKYTKELEMGITELEELIEYYAIDSGHYEVVEEVNSFEVVLTFDSDMKYYLDKDNIAYWDVTNED